MDKTTVHSYIVRGIKAVPVTISVGVSEGIGIHLCGSVQDISVKEILLRVCTAISSIGCKIPGQKIVIHVKTEDGNLIAGDVSSLDLPIAVAMLVASGQFDIPQDELDRYAIAGELGLDGSTREIRCKLGITLAADRVILPRDGSRVLIDDGIEEGRVFLASSINDVPRIFREPEEYDLLNIHRFYEQIRQHDNEADFAFLRGGDRAVRALGIAAAGGHSINLAGCRNTKYLARCLRKILPAIDYDEWVESERILETRGLHNDAPFFRQIRMPHHASSLSAMVGGTDGLMAGEVSLAHNGILVLHEIEEWPNAILAALRGVRKDGYVRISRLRFSVEYPARFTLVGSSKRCPCNQRGDNCTCSEKERTEFRRELAGRSDGLFDMTCMVWPFTIADKPESSSCIEVRLKVEAARERQKERYKDIGILTNSELRPSQVLQYCASTSEARQKLLDLIPEAYGAGCRSRILKVARSIADFEDHKTVLSRHVLEALNYFPL